MNNYCIAKQKGLCLGCDALQEDIDNNYFDYYEYSKTCETLTKALEEVKNK